MRCEVLDSNRSHLAKCVVWWDSRLSITDDAVGDEEMTVIEYEDVKMVEQSDGLGEE